MTVSYDVRDRIAVIAFGRPEQHNAVRAVDIDTLADAFERFDTDDDADVAVLHGPGRSFCSGGDRSVANDPDEFRAQARGQQRVHAAIYESVTCKPLIAAIHGNCLGNAIGWAFNCDLVVAAAGTRLQVTETRFGLVTTNFWALLGGGAFGLDAVLTARDFTAAEAYDAGVVARLAPDGEHLESAIRLATEIAANPGSAVREIVRVRRALAAERLRAVSSLTGAGPTISVIPPRT